MATEVYLVRHGESLGNLENRFLGWTDWDLTDTGKKQAECVADYFDNVELDKIYSSDLIRAQNTIKPTSLRKNLPINTDKGLREIFAGDWEKLLFTEIYEKYPEVWGYWLSGEGEKIITPNGETVHELLERVYAAIEKISKENDGKKLVIALHATPLRVFLNKVCKLNLNNLKDTPWAANASVCKVTYKDGEFTLDFANETCHLGNLITAFPKGV